MRRIESTKGEAVEKCHFVASYHIHTSCWLPLLSFANLEGEFIALIIIKINASEDLKSAHADSQSLVLMACFYDKHLGVLV